MRILVKAIPVAIISISLYAFQEKRCAIDIGSGAMKVQMALFDTEKNEILQLLDEPFYIDIPLANYYAQDGDLSEAIQHKAIKAFNTILERCAEKQITKMAGIATAIFRKADKNGPLLFNALKESAQKKFGKNNVNLQIVSQELEGKLGFLTAAGLSPEFESSDILAWDCGNSSFQLVLQDKKNLLIYEGPFGVANCAQLFIELIRKENYKAGTAINPITIDELGYFIDHLSNMIEVPTDFIEKIHTS